MASLFLMLPRNIQVPDHRLSIYSLKHKNRQNLDLLVNPKNHRCVGSCHGWLAFLDGKFDPFLLHPFSKTLIHLPPKQTLPHRQGHSEIFKLVLSSSAAVACMYKLGLHTKIAFCFHGDDRWRGLDCGFESYFDVLFCNGTSTLLAVGPGPSVESWDLNETNPKKTMVVQHCPRTLLDLTLRDFPTDLYSMKWYLASSPAGEIFLVVRYIGDFVRSDGEVVREGETLGVCPYRTVDFRVFRVDVGRRVWVDVEGLGDFAVFLGGNESVMVSSVECGEVKRSAIYFTDDYWERMDEDFSYGGHDMGVFSMEDGSIEPVLDLPSDKIQSPALLDYSSLFCLVHLGIKFGLLLMETSWCLCYF